MHKTLTNLPYFDKFQALPEYTQLVMLTENSPWHREESVIRHTEMTLEWYNEYFAKDRTPRQQMLARLALLFHDIGKPAAKQEKYRADRGNYLSFGGHEMISARIFENFMAENPDLLDSLNMEWKDVSAITFMIEHHLPFDLKEAKLHDLRKALAFYLSEEDQIVFTDIVQSDAHGRISDGAEEKLANVKAWIDKFYAIPVQNLDISAQATMYMPIGASGSGKTTWTDALISDAAANNREIVIVSLDKYRIDFYKEHLGAKHLHPDNDIDMYAGAFIHANECDAQFRKFYMADFNEKLRNGVDIVIDNTNTSRKSRKFWISAARNHAYGVIAAVFPISKTELARRAQLRTDKNVPHHAIMHQYSTIALPLVGSEVDDLVIVSQ